MNRTTVQTVTFRRSFMLPSVHRLLPPGEYQVESDEELIEGLPFVAYRQLSYRLRLNPSPDVPCMLETVWLDEAAFNALKIKASAIDLGNDSTSSAVGPRKVG